MIDTSNFITVIFGDIKFTEEGSEEGRTADIVRLDQLTKCAPWDLDDFCEKGLETYEAYVVPVEYNGNIYMKGRLMDNYYKSE